MNNLLQKFEALNNREKWLIIATLVVGLLSSWYILFYASLNQEHTQLQQELADIKMQLAAQQQVALQLQSQTVTDPNLANKNKLLTLKNQYQDLQQQMRLLDKKFVPPQLMAKVLSDMLEKNEALTLLELKTLPVTTLLDFAQHDYLVYRHGLELHFSGNYVATLTYLKSLEAMPWNFIWDSIDYQVKVYPVAEITLRVYTLSLEKDWLNV